MKSSQFAPVKRSAKIAKAAVVIDNVKNLDFDGLRINWPESDKVPEAWAFPKRIGNGTFDSFFPEGNANSMPFMPVE